MKISVIGYCTTKFGELWDRSLSDLVEEAIYGALKDAKIEKERIDAIFFGNMMAGILENNLHAGAKIAELIKINKPIFRVESACASGGMAFHLASSYISAGQAKTVLVIGAEKMTDFSPEETVSALAAAASGEEQEAGLTFPGLYAMMAINYLQKYKYSEKNLAYVSYKNHYHGFLNDKAHFRKKIELDSILKSPYVAYPLKVLDCSPISDGASGIIITNDESLKKRSKHKVDVLACETATDSISLKGRVRLDEILATKMAGETAFKKSGIKRSQISVAELHDCFSIAEILAMEDLGFWKKGEGGREITKLSTMLGKNGNLVINTSGGLKSAGHPVGATGVKQIGEIYLQLTGQAEGRQIKNAGYGLAHNVGGSGGTAVVTIMSS